MSSLFRRYELLLPLRFNDGQAVSNDFIADALLELEERFGAFSTETQVIRGFWRHEGRSYRDDLFRVFIDVPDLPESVQFFREFKERLKERFQQIDIWMTSHPVDVL